MKKITVLISTIIVLASCCNNYVITGESTVEELEGKVLYLKVFEDDNLAIIDSSRVVHGKFTFKGKMDSVVMANVFLGDESLMPVVVDGEDVKIEINQTQQKISGSPLNDSLYSFIQRKSILDAEMAQLPHMESKMIMEGMDHDEVINILSSRVQDLNMANDRLITRFILDNATNVLGPGVFMILTSSLEYPILNPQIEEITMTAPKVFLEHPYVKEYLRLARENMELMNK